MNNIDLTELLKDCPEGTTLYSPLVGKDVYFIEINGDYIDCKYYNDVNELFYSKISFNKNGSLSKNGECMLFPSKDQRDWSKRVSNKFDISTLKPFDKVLVRYAHGKWACNMFLFYCNTETFPFHCMNDTTWSRCIPYNDDTKHLLGTTNDCDKYYKTWEE